MQLIQRVDQKGQKKGDEQSHVLDHHSTTSPESNNLLTCDDWDENRMGKNEQACYCVLNQLWGDTCKSKQWDCGKTVGSQSSFNSRHFGLKGLGLN